MDKFIANVTAQKPLGIPTGQKCLIVSKGPYAGRMAILYAASSPTIKIVTADPPYGDFATPVDVITDSADSPFDATFNDSSDILVTFIGSGNNELKFVRLSFSGGTWTPGSANVVYDGSVASHPVIRRLSTGPLWIFYTREYEGNYYICGKVSGDDGDNWTPSSDPGDTLSSGADSAYSLMVERNTLQYVIYSEGSNKISCRIKPNSGIVWGGETVLTTEGGHSEHFHAAVSTDGRIGLAYRSASGLKFREFNGSYWTAQISLDDEEPACPVVSYQGGNAFVLYSRQSGQSMNKAFYVKQETTGFSEPSAIDIRRSTFDSVLVYNASAGTYQDKTGEAESAETADVFHSGSNALLSGVSDALFLGLKKPFNFINLVLSTAGSGGEVVWKYWDGQNWQAFIPYSGSWQFSSGMKELLLWSDFNSIPKDWQKKVVSGQEAFWICAAVTSAFSTAPIGSQINAISNLKSISGQV